MSAVRTLGDMIRRLKWVVAFNEGQTDLEFAGPTEDPDRYFRDALNEAYVDEIDEVTQHGDPTWFYATTELTWPTNDLSLALPEGLRDRELIKIIDVTNSDVGTPLWFADWEENAAHFWFDRRTMRWPPNGPSSDRTLRVTYLEEASEMKGDEDEPFLVPAKYRHLLVWSAARILRTVADDEGPSSWKRKADEIRERFIKHMYSRGPSQTGAPGIRNIDPDYYGPVP
jgi:hypothetical protein